MNVDRIDVRLEPRPNDEAQDLGLQLLRRNARATFGALAAVMVPIWLLLLAADWPVPEVSLFVIWWLKPLMDRIVLHVLSRSVFGQTPRISETLAALPSLLDRPLIASLTWRRLQFRRSVWLPTACLEGLKGKALAGRQRVLEGGDVLGSATLSTVVFMHLELGLSIAVYTLVTTFLPEGVVPPMEDLLTDSDAARSPGYLWVSTLSWLPTLFVLEAFYTAAGFGLYLSRRTELEGWDVELAFGRLGARVQAAARRGVALFLGLALALGLSGVAEAQPQEQGSRSEPATTQVSPAEAAAEVLEHPDFETEVTRTRLLNEPRGMGSNPFGPLLATGVKFLALAVLLGAVIALVVYLARRVERPHLPELRKRTPPPTEAFGLDLRLESLPSDVAAAARDLVARGDFVAALSLLYRGALARLVDEDHLEIGPGDTEHDCIEHVRASTGPEFAPRAGYFSRLTESWLRAAWGASPPDRASALTLCDDWTAHFQVAS